jgi:hypothetical protein
MFIKKIENKIKFWYFSKKMIFKLLEKNGFLYFQKQNDFFFKKKYFLFFKKKNLIFEKIYFFKIK